MFCECSLVMNKYIKPLCLSSVNAKAADLCSLKSVCLHCISISLLNIFSTIHNLVFWFSIIENTSFRMLSATPSDRRRNPAVAFRVMGVDLCLAFGTKARASITIGLRDSAPYAKSKSVILA